MVKVVVFDLGGVLYTYDHCKLMDDISGELGVSEPKISIAWRKFIIEYEYGNISENEFWSFLLKELGLECDSQILHDIVIGHFQPIDKSLELLKSLRGRYILGLVTNQTSWIYELNDKYKFRKYFDIVLASNEVGLRKPQREIFDLFVEKSKVNPREIIFIDDSLGYKKSVEATEMNFIHFKNPKQLRNDIGKFGV